MSHVILFILAITVKWYLTKLYIFACALMCAVDYKQGDQEEFPSAFQHTVCDRVGENQSM